MIEVFRQEIIEAAKSRTDLLKWKLILVSTLAAIGLGINTSGSNVKPMIGFHFVLCLIPLVSVYVDLLCKNLQIRILAISEFFQSQKIKDPNNEFLCFQLYEEFCDSIREEFNFEDWTQQWSTIFLSFLIIVLAFIIGLSWMDRLTLIISGICGIVLILRIDKSYRDRCKKLKKKAQNLVSKHELEQGEK
jgi:hypothetical protein